MQIMSLTTVRIDDELLAKAKTYGQINNRSALEQLVYWAKIGKIAQDNPDLSYEDISNILQSMADVDGNTTKLYKFD